MVPKHSQRRCERVCVAVLACMNDEADEVSLLLSDLREINYEMSARSQ